MAEVSKTRIGGRLMPSGSITEYDDGTAAYFQYGKWLQSFRVRIADVTGVSETRGGKKTMQNTLHIMGLGGELASCDINVGLSREIEAWFRAHPDFGRNSRLQGAPPSPVADELAKLAALRDAGVLTASEFAAQKAKLLG